MKKLKTIWEMGCTAVQHFITRVKYYLVPKFYKKVCFWSLNFKKFFFSSLNFIKSFFNSLETKIGMKKKLF